MTQSPYSGEAQPVHPEPSAAAIQAALERFYISPDSPDEPEQIALQMLRVAYAIDFGEGQ